MLVHVLVLNFNGRRLLADCLPTVVAAAARARHACDVTVIDNGSTDDSRAWLAAEHPHVRVIRCPNRGLCSFNDVIATLPGRVAVLLNNDLRLAADCIDPLVEPLLDDASCFLTAAQCRSFDGAAYEGQKTAVGWRFGLVQATSLFPGHAATDQLADWTASAGAAIAVDCRRFLDLGGFDPRYLPGRLEDLDFAYRGYQAGWHAQYVPAAIVYHLGMGSFGPAFGRVGCDRLALRNTLLFQWKNLRHPRHVARQALGLPIRLLADVLRAARLPAAERWATWRAVYAALVRLVECRDRMAPGRRSLRRERSFFQRFHPRRMRRPASVQRIELAANEAADVDSLPTSLPIGAAR